MVVLTVNNLNLAFLTQVLVAKDVPYNFRENNSLALPRAKTTLCDTDTTRFIGKKYDRYCQSKSKSPNQYRFSSKTLNQLDTLIADVDYAKILFQT